MEAGSKVWVRDKKGDQAWLLGDVVSKTSSTITVEIDEDVVEKVRTFDYEPGIEINDVKMANDKEMDCVEDLISLPHLHEAAILHSLTQRFKTGSIYTFTANAILLAVNPFKSMPIYGIKLLQEYYTQGVMRQQGIETNKKLAPHIFSIADSAYRDMMTGMHSGTSNIALGPIDQSILISGESGAGKTESTKVVMKYLTTVGNANGITELEEGSVMDRVLQSNPILEAFGNARTIRNDNSSRFGKFIELLFDKRGILLGAKIETYLLEKVRIPNQSEHERNFHIFYQMTKGANDDERKNWDLEGPEEYKFSNQGDCFDLNRVEDEEEFVFTKKALLLMGFSTDTQNSIFSLVASLLHLGQVEFVSNDDENAEFSSDGATMNALANVSRLAYLPRDGLEKALTERTIEIGVKSMHEIHTIKLEERQANDARDALAKAIYGQLFNHIVGALNANINCSRKDVRASIGVLDIFGFECFKKNSFEQLCINYTNETLQQQFNQFVFKMEQKEYTKEGIEWCFIEFPDNQDCLDLIEGRPEGLLAMLDDECRMGVRGSDKNYASRLYKTHANTERVYSDSALQRELKFGLRHYAGEVIYSVESFMDKNKDELPKESNELFASSSSSFIRELFSSDPKKSTKKSSRPKLEKKRSLLDDKSAIKKPTVGTQFKEQLHNLMDMIRDTRPHYIRCVKPNDLAKPDLIHRPRVMEQLRYGGVLEAVRVARSGFPVRMPHKEIYQRYRLLVFMISEISPQSNSGLTFSSALKKFPLSIKSDATDAGRKNCEDLVKIILKPIIEHTKEIPNDTIQFGKTKVFLRKNAYDALEMLRSQRMVDSAIMMQSFVRGHLYFKVFKMQRAAVLTLQCFVRRVIACKVAYNLRCNKAAKQIQTFVRCKLACKKYSRFYIAVIQLQALHRGNRDRKLYINLLQNTKSIIIQRWAREFTKRRQYTRLRSATLALQCAVRQRTAKKVLKKLRTEAKDVGNLKRDNELLKAEMVALKEAARKATADREAAAAAASAIAAKKAAEEVAEALQEESKKLKKRVTELEEELQQEKEKNKNQANKVLELSNLLQESRKLSLKANEDLSLARQESQNFKDEAKEAKKTAQVESEKTRIALIEAEKAKEEASRTKESLELALKSASSSIDIDENKFILKAESAELEVAVLKGEVEELKLSLALTQDKFRTAEAAANAANVRLGNVKDSEKTMKTDGTATPPDQWDSMNDVEMLSEDEKAYLTEKLNQERSIRNTLEAEKMTLLEQIAKTEEEMSILRATASAAESAAAASATALESRLKREERVVRLHLDSNLINGEKDYDITSQSSSPNMLNHKTNIYSSKLKTDIGSPLSPPARGMRIKSRSNSGIVMGGIDFSANNFIPALANLEMKAYQQDTMDEFEDRLAAIKQGLSLGVDVTVWDGRNKKVDAVLKLEEYPPEGFDTRREDCPFPRLAFQLRGSYLIWRANIKPVAIDNFLIVQQGSKAVPEIGEQYDSFCITLRRQTPIGRDQDRIIVLKVNGEDARRDLYSAVRKLLTEATLRPRTPRTISLSQIPPQMPPIQMITMHESSRGSFSQDASLAAVVAVQTDQIAELRKELDERIEGHERITLQMMEMTNDLNKKEDESKTLTRKLNDTLAEITELRGEYATYKEVTTKFIRRIDMLQCEVDELIEENSVLKQTMRRHYHGSSGGSFGQISPTSSRTASSRSTPHTSYANSIFNTPSPR
mmetsp:Transcript_676/g.962  ORF Transcript_676/g.962 Transcript_676/m.962 type:complete len:1715 (-) Transcript_676:47-5191(-)